MGTTVGFTFFTMISYFLLILNIHFLLIPIILIIDIFALKTLKFPKKIDFFPNFFPKLKLILIITIFLLGIIGQLLIIAPSGSYVDGDLVFWSAHGHDGSWHLSLMAELKKGYPLQNPAFAGEKLTNYHFFSDIAPADFNKYFKIPALDLYFRFFPLIFSVLLGSLSFILGSRLGGFWAGLWITIFTYFAGSFGYIVTFIQNKTIGGESLFWASQIQSSIGNPPQIISSIIILAFLVLFLNLLKTGRGFLICALLAGTLIMFKAYGGVVILLSLLAVAIWQILRMRKVQFLILFTVSSVISAIIYFPNTSGTSAFLIFEPWWFIRTMVVAPDKLNWLDLELKRQTYIFEENWKRVIQVELTAFLIFFFGNLGMRFLGLLYLFQNTRKIFSDYFFTLFFMIILISFIFPLLFLQKGVASNTIQFFQYFLLLMGIAAGITTSKVLGKVKGTVIKIVLSLLLIMVLIPTQIALIYSFYNRSPFAKISSSEVQALNFLRENTDPESIILTPPYNKYLDLKKEIPDIWDWFDTAYVAAFSERRVYLSDTEQVDIMGYDLNSRLKFQEDIFAQDNLIIFNKNLKEHGINYIYFPKPLRPSLDLDQSSLKQVYTNDLVEIWQVDTEENQPE